MRAIINCLEFRLVIPGKPESFRSAKSMAFRNKIASIARQIFTEPFRGDVNIYVDYFHTRNRRMDMDNLSKNILDSLTGIAYFDDKQVKLQNSRAHFLRTRVSITDLPLDSIKPLKFYEEYLFIRIRESR